ncbi:MAG: hypothetical protein JNK56_01080 [Myxococcales bacterium]|nr:hypothetical protein [Myxococcales bacterium]
MATNDPIKTWTHMNADGEDVPLRSAVEEALLELAEHLDPHQILDLRHEPDIARMTAARKHLAFALDKIDAGRPNLPAAAEDVRALIAALDEVAEGLKRFNETGRWPLTIKPSKPPRADTANEWEQTAEVAGDDDVKREGRQPDAGQRFLKTTAGKVVAGGALVVLARWILR